MFLPVSFVVWECGHDPEVDLREGHLLEGTAIEAEYEKLLTYLKLFGFLVLSILKTFAEYTAPRVDCHSNERNIGIRWFLGWTKRGCPCGLLANLDMF